MSATPTTIAALAEHGAALATLAVDLREAVAIQWSEPPNSARAAVAYSADIADPARIALDSRRLRVCVAVLAAETRLAVAADDFAAASVALRGAAHAWREDA